MKRSEVRALIQSAVDALSESVRFNSGRITEFNSNRSNQYPYLWLEPLSLSSELSQTQMPIDSWACIVHIANKDAIDSKPEQYEAVVDSCDELAQKFIYRLNQVVTGFNLLTLSDIRRDPFIHRHADDVSGVVISFTLTLPDTTDVC